MRTQRTLGSAVAAVLLALVGSLFVAAPAHAGTTPVAIDILGKFTSKSAIHDDGKGPALGNAARVSLAGVLTSGGAAVPGKSMQLQRLPKGSSSWTTVGTGTTSSSGRVQIVVDAQGPATYRLFFDGSSDPTYASAYSPERKVKIMRDLNSKYSQKGNKLIFKGKVTPKWSKKKVILERSNSKDGKYKKVKTGKTNKKGKWSFRLGAPRKGEWWYRAYVPAKKGYAKSLSHILVNTYTI